MSKHSISPLLLSIFILITIFVVSAQAQTYVIRCSHSTSSTTIADDSISCSPTPPLSLTDALVAGWTRQNPSSTLDYDLIIPASCPNVFFDSPLTVRYCVNDLDGQVIDATDLQYNISSPHPCTGITATGQAEATVSLEYQDTCTAYCRRSTDPDTTYALQCPVPTSCQNTATSLTFTRVYKGADGQIISTTKALAATQSACVPHCTTCDTAPQCTAPITVQGESVSFPNGNVTCDPSFTCPCAKKCFVQSYATADAAIAANAIADCPTTTSATVFTDGWTYKPPSTPVVTWTKALCEAGAAFTLATYKSVCIIGRTGYYSTNSGCATSSTLPVILEMNLTGFSSCRFACRADGSSLWGSCTDPLNVAVTGACSGVGTARDASRIVGTFFSTDSALTQPLATLTQSGSAMCGSGQCEACPNSSPSRSVVSCSASLTLPIFDTDNTNHGVTTPSPRSFTNSAECTFYSCQSCYRTACYDTPTSFLSVGAATPTEVACISPNQNSPFEASDNWAPVLTATPTSCSDVTFKHKSIYTYCREDGANKVAAAAFCGLAVSAGQGENPNGAATTIIISSSCAASCSIVQNAGWGPCSTPPVTATCTKDPSVVSVYRGWFFPQDTNRKHLIYMDSTPLVVNVMCTQSLCASCLASSCQLSFQSNDIVFSTTVPLTGAQCTAASDQCPCMACSSSTTLALASPNPVIECPTLPTTFAQVYVEPPVWTIAQKPTECTATTPFTYTYNTVVRYCVTKGLVAPLADCATSSPINALYQTITTSPLTGATCVDRCKLKTGGSGTWKECNDATEFKPTGCTTDQTPALTRQVAKFISQDTLQTTAPFTTPIFSNPTAPTQPPEEIANLNCARTGCTAALYCQPVPGCTATLTYPTTTFPVTSFQTASCTTVSQCECPSNVAKCFNSATLVTGAIPPTATEIPCPTTTTVSNIYASPTDWAYVAPQTTQTTCSSSTYRRVGYFKYCTQGTNIVTLSGCGAEQPAVANGLYATITVTATGPETCARSCSPLGVNWFGCDSTSSWTAPTCRADASLPKRETGYFHSADVALRDKIYSGVTETAAALSCINTSCSAASCGEALQCTPRITDAAGLPLFTFPTLTKSAGDPNICTLANPTCPCLLCITSASKGTVVDQPVPGAAPCLQPTQSTIFSLAADNSRVWVRNGSPGDQATCSSTQTYTHSSIVRQCFVGGNLQPLSGCGLTGNLALFEFFKQSVSFPACQDFCRPAGTLTWVSCSSSTSWPAPNCSAPVVVNRELASFVSGDVGALDQITTAVVQPTSGAPVCSKSTCSSTMCGFADQCTVALPIPTSPATVFPSTTPWGAALYPCSVAHPDCACSVQCSTRVLAIGATVTGNDFTACPTVPLTLASFFDLNSVPAAVPSNWSLQTTLAETCPTSATFYHNTAKRYCIVDGKVTNPSRCSLTPAGGQQHAPLVALYDNTSASCTAFCSPTTGSSSSAVLCTSDDSPSGGWSDPVCVPGAAAPTRIRSLFFTFDTTRVHKVSTESTQTATSFVCTTPQCTVGQCQTVSTCRASITYGGKEFQHPATITVCTTAALVAQCQCSQKCFSISDFASQPYTRGNPVPIGPSGVCPQLTDDIYLSDSTGLALRSSWTWTREIVDSQDPIPNKCKSEFQHTALRVFCVRNGIIATASLCGLTVPLGVDQDTWKKTVDSTSCLVKCARNAGFNGQSTNLRPTDWKACDDMATWTPGTCSTDAAVVPTRSTSRFHSKDVNSYFPMVIQGENYPSPIATTCQMVTCDSTQCQTPSSCKATLDFGSSLTTDVTFTSSSSQHYCDSVKSACGCSSKCSSSPISIIEVPCPTLTAVSLYPVSGSAVPTATDWAVVPSAATDCSAATYRHKTIYRHCVVGQGNEINPARASCGLSEDTLFFQGVLTFGSATCVQLCKPDDTAAVWVSCPNTWNIPDKCDVSASPAATRRVASFNPLDIDHIHPVFPVTTQTAAQTTCQSPTCQTTACGVLSSCNLAIRATLESAAELVGLNKNCAALAPACSCAVRCRIGVNPLTACDAAPTPDKLYTQSEGLLDKWALALNQPSGQSETSCDTSVYAHRQQRKFCTVGGTNLFSGSTLPSACSGSMLAQNDAHTVTVNGFGLTSCDIIKCARKSTATITPVTTPLTYNGGAANWVDCTSTSQPTWAPPTCGALSVDRVQARFRAVDNVFRDPILPTIMTAPSASSSCAMNTCNNCRTSQCTSTMMIAGTQFTAPFTDTTPGGCTAVDNPCRCFKVSCYPSSSPAPGSNSPWSEIAVTAGYTGSCDDLTPKLENIFTEWRPTLEAQTCNALKVRHHTLRRFCFEGAVQTDPSNCGGVFPAGIVSLPIEATFTGFAANSCNVDQCTTAGSTTGWQSCTDTAQTYWNLPTCANAPTQLTRNTAKFHPLDTGHVYPLQSTAQTAAYTCQSSTCSTVSCLKATQCRSSITVGGTTWTRNLVVTESEPNVCTTANSGCVCTDFKCTDLTPVIDPDEPNATPEPINCKFTFDADPQFWALQAPTTLLKNTCGTPITPVFTTITSCSVSDVQSCRQYAMSVHLPAVTPQLQLTCAQNACSTCNNPQLITKAEWNVIAPLGPKVTLPATRIPLLSVGAAFQCECTKQMCVAGTAVPLVSSPLWTTCSSMDTLIPNHWALVSDFSTCSSNGFATQTELRRVARCFSADNGAMAPCTVNIPQTQWLHGSARPCVQTKINPSPSSCPSCGNVATLCTPGSVTVAVTSSITQIETVHTYQYGAQCPVCTCEYQCLRQSALPTDYDSYQPCVLPTEVSAATQWALVATQPADALTCNTATMMTNANIQIDRKIGCIATGASAVSKKIWVTGETGCIGSQPSKLESYPASCNRPSCDKCKQATSCSAKITTPLVSTNFAQVALPVAQCSSQCQCQLMCGEVPCQQTATTCSAQTFGQVYDTDDCKHRVEPWLLTCSAEEESKRTDFAYSCERFCVPTTIWTQTYKTAYDLWLADKINNPAPILAPSDRQPCDASNSRPSDSTTASCTPWDPLPTQRRVTCIDRTSGRVIDCPQDQKNDTRQPALGSCVTLCTRSNAASILGSNIDLTTRPDVVECNHDSFRDVFCTDRPAARNVYCSVKPESGSVYSVQQLGSCDGANYADIKAYTCTVGCYVSQMSDVTLTPAQLALLNSQDPVSLHKIAALLSSPPGLNTQGSVLSSTGDGLFFPQCHENSFRRLLPHSCPIAAVDASTKRTVKCVYRMRDSVNWENQLSFYHLTPTDECAPAAMSSALQRTWSVDQCGSRCVSIATTVPDAFSPVQSLGEVCTATSFRPTSGITNCDPISASAYRRVFQVYSRSDGDVVALGLTGEALFFSTQVWQSSCQVGHRCQLRLSPTTNQHYAQCNDDRLKTTYCSTICNSAFPIPPDTRRCLRTLDWFGNPMNAADLVTAATGCSDPPVFACGCGTTQYCLSNTALGSESPVPCSDENGWTLSSECGHPDGRRSYLMTAAGTPIQSTSCTAATCIGVSFASVERIPRDVSTLCAPQVVCTATGSQPVLAGNAGGLTPSPTCSSSDDVIFGPCNESNCNNRVDNRDRHVLFNNKKMALATVQQNINEVRTDTVRTAFFALISVTASNALSTVLPSRQCPCTVRPWCRTPLASSTAIASLLFTDVVACDASPEQILPCDLSCKPFQRNGIVCRQPNGTFQPIAEPLGTCGEAAIPQCPLSHVCKSADFCTQLDVFADVVTSPECDQVAGFDDDLCWEFNQGFPTDGNPEFALSTCTSNPLAQYFQRRTVQCLTFYNPEPHLKAPLPLNIRDKPTVCDAGPQAVDRRSGCTLYTSCPAGIVGPLTLTPLSDLTMYSEQFHEHGSVTIAWASHRGPAISANTVVASYTLAGSLTDPEAGSGWIDFTQTTRLDARSLTVSLPVLTTDTQSSIDVFIRLHISGTTNYVYFAQSISVKNFRICRDLNCPARKPGNFECFIPLVTDTVLQRSAICRCDSSVNVMWTSGRCDQIQSCLESSIRCQNDGYFEFDRATPTFCSSTCTCPGGQSGSLCQGQCPDNSCHTTQGIMLEGSTSCACSSCHSGFAGPSCSLCSRLTALRMTNPTNSTPQLFGNTKRKINFYSSLSTFMANALRLPAASVTIDGTRTTLTNTTLVLVLSIAGNCGTREGQAFTQLQSTIPTDPALVTIAEASQAWEALLLESLDDSPEFRTLVQSGAVSENAQKMELIDPSACIKQKTCPDFVNTTCETEPDHPRCAQGSKVSSGVVVAIVIPIICLLGVVLLGVLLWKCGCCDAHPEEFEKEQKEQAERQREKQVVKQKPNRRDRNRDQNNTTGVTIQTGPNTPELPVDPIASSNHAEILSPPSQPNPQQQQQLPLESAAPPALADLSLNLNA